MLKLNDRISHYRVVGPLGAGGMGEVYRAHDESLERDVALKILPSELVSDEGRIRRFIQEAKAASSLSHPHIVTIHEIGQAEVDSTTVHYISMELVRGDTLRQLIHGEKTALRILLRYLAQAADGLATAHAAGIVHRDLKPDNIMVTKDGFAKVLDFGLAKLTEPRVPVADLGDSPTATLHKTGEGVVLGTIGYMSPEQVQGKPVDQRSDIFSFGCILYEASTRKQPFAGESSVETMHKILKDKPAPIEELNAAAPAELRRLIRRCLSKSPDERHHSMKDIAIELREIVDEYDALSASASSGSGTAAIALTKRRVAIVPLVVVVGALTVAAVLAGVWVMRRVEYWKPATAFQSIKMTTVPGQGDVSSAALSPDGRYLAFVSGPPERTSVWVRQVSTGSVVEVPHGTASPDMLTFAPDGEHLVFVDRDPEIPAQNALFEIPVLGGTPIKLASHVDFGVTFAPDGKRVCFARAWPDKKPMELIILDLNTGRDRVLSTIQAPAILGSGPAWSPDGEKIATEEAVVSGGLKFTLVTFRVSDGRRDVVATGSTFAVKELAWLRDGSGLVLSALSLPEFHGELWLVPYPGGGARRITNDTGDYWSLSLASDGTSLAAIRTSSVLNLWEAEPRASGGIQQLTSATANENALMKYSVGHDGSVVFMSNDPSQRLWRIGADRSAPVPLRTEGTLAAWLFPLPDGGVVYMRFGANSVPHIWRVEPNGPPRQVTTGSGEALVGLSPNGLTLLFWPTEGTSAGGLWTVPIIGGEPTRVVASWSSSKPFPMFSPDGSHIAYLDRSEVDGRQQKLWKVIPTTGGKPIASLSLGARPDHPAASPDAEWAADGKALTFLDGVNGVANVFRQPLDGGKPEPITRFTEGEISDHEWSPDGRRLLLVRGNGQIENIWMTAADGSGAVQLTDFRTGQIDSVDWVPPDGRRIVFSYGQATSDVVLIKNFR